MDWSSSMNNHWKSLNSRENSSEIKEMPKELSLLLSRSNRKELLDKSTEKKNKKSELSKDNKTNPKWKMKSHKKRNRTKVFKWEPKAKSYSKWRSNSEKKTLNKCSNSLTRTLNSAVKRLLPNGYCNTDYLDTLYYKNTNLLFDSFVFNKYDMNS